MPRHEGLNRAVERPRSVTEAATQVPDPRIAADPPEDVPPSAQTVYRILAVEGPLTHKEIVEISEMPPRTVRYAVSRLKEAGYLGERCNLMDCRQCFFFINATCPGGEEETAKGKLSKL